MWQSIFLSEHIESQKNGSRRSAAHEATAAATPLILAAAIVVWRSRAELSELPHVAQLINSFVDRERLGQGAGR